MGKTLGNLAAAEIRREDREEVHFRARAFGPDAKLVNLLIVNISPHGLMARCEACFDVGDRVRIQLPIAGDTLAEVRWSLGGRIGCQFDSAIDLAAYYELISAMLRGK